MTSFASLERDLKRLQNDLDIAKMGVNTSSSGSLAAHEGAADPHSQYLTQAEADLLYDPLGGGGGGVDTSGSPSAGQYARFTDADTIEGVAPASVRTDIGAEASGAAAAAVAAHEAAGDPHPTYLTAAEGNAAYAALSHGTHVVANGIGNTELRDFGACTILGRSVNSTGDPADIAAGANDRILRRVADVIDFGQITVGMAPDALWTNAKLANMAANTAKVNATAGSAAPADLAMAASTILARLAAGNIVAATVTELRTLLGLSQAVYNQSTAAQGPGFAADTYLTGSACAIPSGKLQVGTRYRLVFNVVKTGAGTAAPVINIRFGTAGSTADTSRGTLTWSVQTAVIDEGVFTLWATFRAVGGASAVIQTLGLLTHRLSITGFGTGVSESEIATSGTFDSTVANSIIGVSVNGGASASWTVSLVQAALENLAP